MLELKYTQKRHAGASFRHLDTNTHRHTHTHMHSSTAADICSRGSPSSSCITARTTHTSLTPNLSPSLSLYLPLACSILLCCVSLLLWIFLFFIIAYLKFLPGHKVLHSAEDFYSWSLGMGQPVQERQIDLVQKKKPKSLQMFPYSKLWSGLFWTSRNSKQSLISPCCISG